MRTSPLPPRWVHGTSSSVGTLDSSGFIVPHTLPYSTRDVEPVTYNWCHGPAGTSQLFAALAMAGVQDVGGLPVAWLRQQCLEAILSSGVPARLRPGFWDNDGRCCGTAGVGDVLLDAAQDGDDQTEAARLLEGARVMGAALAERAVRGQGGACWRFTEHRKDPPLLPPGTSWMQGAAGIAAFLLRLARVMDTGLDCPGRRPAGSVVGRTGTASRGHMSKTPRMFLPSCMSW